MVALKLHNYIVQWYLWRITARFQQLELARTKTGLDNSANVLYPHTHTLRVGVI